MNDRKSSLPDESGQHKGGGAPVSLSRRRFAKGAAPVVLGTLVSKPVLGAEYICTVSGHASGNTSAHATNEADCDVGSDITDWKSATTWPGLFIKGDLPDLNNCNFSASDTGSSDKKLIQGTTFSQLGLTNRYFYSTDKSDACAVAVFTADPDAKAYLPASMLQVLQSTSSSSSSDVVVRLGQATVVSLLNAADPSITYPISQARIIEMFNAVVDDGTYHVGGANLNLTRLGVIRYLEKLYS